ncbi:MAG: LysR substrate-binding domain-containing protein [Lachnospiraceae bacterium]|nr:LysR substrate-binding domain-containing protein [Lachnospiraceae bacterium]MCM1230801.1 LysR substrate-binding domain-containing protein [Ruminococcus flavefaciens]
MLENGIAQDPLTLGSMETTASVYLPKLLATYHQANPMVQLSLNTGTTADNLERVLSREFDTAFVAGPINHPDLEQQIFTIEDLVLVTGKIEPADTPWRDLKHQTLLVFPYGCCYRKVLEQLVQQEGITPEHIIEFNSLGAILASICAGLGISLLPTSVVEPYLSDGIMSSFTIPEAHSVISTVLVYRKDHYMNTAFREFLKIAKG